MAAAVDEERRRAGDAALVGADDVLADARRVHPAAQILGDAVGVEPELLGVAPHVARAQLALMVEEDVVHVPEATLCGRGFGGLRSQLRVRMHVVEREMAPDVAHVVAEGRQQLADRVLGLPAVRAFEVPVLEQRHRGVLGAADVVALGIDVVGEVEDVVGGARDLPCAQRRGQAPDDLQDRPRDERRDDDGGQGAELRLVEAAGPRTRASR